KNDRNQHALRSLKNRPSLAQEPKMSLKAARPTCWGAVERTRRRCIDLSEERFFPLFFKRAPPVRPLFAWRLGVTRHKAQLPVYLYGTTKKARQASRGLSCLSEGRFFFDFSKTGRRAVGPLFG